MPAKTRLFVIDDSVLVRHLLKLVFHDHPSVEMTGAAANGSDALARLRTQPADVVTLDSEIPGADSLEVVRQLRQLHPGTRVILFTPATRLGAATTFDALMLGADDFIVKNTLAPADHSIATLRAALSERVGQFFAAPAMPLASAPAPPTHPSRFRMVAIAASTGGPRALAQLLAQLPSRFPLPVMVALHAPPMFTRVFADRLDSLSLLDVAEAQDGMDIDRGRVLVAPGNQHLRIKRSSGGWAAAVDQSSPEQGHRPAIDAMFRSLAEHFGPSLLSVVLTGAGSDGVRGVQAVKSAGGYCIAQDCASSAVAALPGAIAEAGLADQVVPLDGLAAELLRLTGVPQ